VHHPRKIVKREENLLTRGFHVYTKFRRRWGELVNSRGGGWGGERSPEKSVGQRGEILGPKMGGGGGGGGGGNRGEVENLYRVFKKRRTYWKQKQGNTRKADRRKGG